MQHLEVSGAVVLYIGRTVSKGECVFKLHVNVILPSTPEPSKCSLSFSSTHQKPYCITLTCSTGEIL
jgi:hypothetical protein